MRRATLAVLIFMLVWVLVSCSRNNKKELCLAYTMAQSKPDSALTFLHRMNQAELSDADMAKYALIYYMAQDKSGLNVDDDSLIRIAYVWYDKHQDDSLYALCLNYMGTYYMLSDSLEKAKACLNKSYHISDSINDVRNKCLALDKLIEIEEKLNPVKAVGYARNLVDIYDNMPQNTMSNRIYARLRLCENLMFVDSLYFALSEGKIAMELAKQIKNPESLSSVYQDLSCIYGELGMKDSCLSYAKKAYNLQESEVFSCQLALVSAYLKSDSLDQAALLLRKAHPQSLEDSYTVFYMRSQIAMKMFDYEKAKEFSDSAYNCLEDMYHQTLREKSDYYNSILQKEKEKANLKGKTEMQQWVFGLTVILFIVVVSFILYVYKSYKKQIRQKMTQERKQAEIRLSNEQKLYQQKEEIHQKELSHKESQISIMRNYLLKRIEIVEKINTFHQKEGKHFVLSEKDWVELEVFLDSVEDLFVTRLRQRFPNLSEADLQLMMLLRLKLSQKDLASIYCISEKAIKQKLFLYKDKVGIKKEHFSLRNYIERF